MTRRVVCLSQSTVLYSLRQDESCWMKNPPPDRLLSSPRHPCRAPLMWIRLRLSAWLTQQTICRPLFVFRHISSRLPLPLMAFLIAAFRIISWVKWFRRIIRTLADSNIQERAQRWAEESRGETDPESEQSMVRCKKACVWRRAKCKAGFTAKKKKEKSRLVSQKELNRDARSQNRSCWKKQIVRGIKNYPYAENRQSAKKTKNKNRPSR